MNYKRCVKETLFKNTDVFITGPVVGLLAYMYALTNKLYNWDEIFFSFSKGYSLYLGRWGLDLLQWMFPNYSMPWLWGILSIFLVTISAWIVIDTFGIRQTLLRILITGLMVSFPTIISLFSYMFMSVPYTLALLLVALSFRLCAQTGGGTGVQRGLISCVLLVFSCSIYQAFASLFASYCVLGLIADCLERRKNSIRRFIRCGFILLASLIAYLFITLLLLSVSGMGFDGLLGRASGGEETVSFFQRIWNIFLYFAGYLGHGTSGLIPTKLSMIAHFVAMVVVVVMLIQQVKNGCSAMIIVASACLPVAINSIILISTGTHTLMVYSFTTLYILAAILEEHVLCSRQTKGLETGQGRHPGRMVNLPRQNKIERKRFTSAILTCAMGIIVLSNIYIANHVYLKMTYENSNLYSFYTTLVGRIESCPGYSEGDRIALVGESPLEGRWDWSEFPRCSITGTNEIDINIYSKHQYIKYYLGADMDFMDLDERKKLVTANQKAFDDMPIYPYDGSVKRIDNTILVKMGEKEKW